MATSISNGESGLSVRTKLNDIWHSLDLNEYNKDITDDAVDVFVYDTSKDSDGGAWRKRTQGTSWYNETLNTATRGSRKEFPAVAVIVAENGTVTIYDGDDPDLPMWMVFNSGSTGSPLTYRFILTGGVTVVTASNGQISVGRATLTVVDFVGDRAAYIAFNNLGSFGGASVSERNNYHDQDAGTNYLTADYIVSNTVNDVAMTVLPNAPIDAATGLPVPTIAVATDGGVSVIKDDGTVVDSSLTVGISSVSFTENNALIYNRTDLPGSVGDPVQVQLTIPTADGFTADQVFGSTVSPASNKWNNPDVVGTSDDDFVVGSGGNNIGFNYISNEVNDKTSGMTVQVTSEFNSGWMNGDIKLATLSDTDDTDVTGSELVTNGTFDTDTSGWTASNATLSVVSSTLKVADNGSNSTAYQAITTTVGSTYTVSLDVVEISGAVARVLVHGSAPTAGYTGTYLLDTSSTGSYGLTFTATASTTYLQLCSESTHYVRYDNISVRLAEEDRSVNGNGLQVFGTVTKSAVATGADLVGYSGFNASNYLMQPYNSDLDFGTGDFCVMGWNKGTDTAGYLIARNDGSGSTDRIAVDLSSSKYRFYLEAGATGILTSTSDANTNTWTQFCALRRSGATELYINGKLEASGTSAVDLDNSSCVLHIGDVPHVGNGYYGSLALFRISATAPSPEQIKKIYEDEKVLFQENAQATLYGSSDAVTALAYDDSNGILSVGTSAGRSDFQGLRRVNNTTNAVGAAISASNGMIVEE